MKKMLSLILAAMMILSMAACGGSAPAASAAPAASGAAPAASAAPAAPAAPAPIEKLVVALPNWPTSLDPVAHMGKQNTRWLTQVFDTLLYCENDGSVSSYICEDWKMVDELTAEFKLKSGITFHNGDPLTANDVKYSYDRVLLDESGYVNANIPGVVGTIAGIEVVDDLTLRMTTESPDPILFDRVAAMLGVYIVPQKYLEEVGTDVFGTDPMGTGPYKVDDITPEAMQLSYYEGYYGEAPIAPKMEYRYVAEETAMITGLVNKDIDIAFDLSSTAIEMLAKYDHVNGFNMPYSSSHLLRINTKSGPTSDKLLRQAMSLAIDRQLLVDTLWGEFAVIPNGYNYEEFGRFYIEDYPEYEYNLEKAKELVSKSSYNGEEFTFQVVPGYYPMGSEAAEAIIDMWKDVGINARVEYVESYKVGNITGLANWSNGLRFSDPLGGLWTLWGEGSAPQKNLWDAPARFNELGHLMEGETDVEKRREYYREMMEIWDDEIPGTILYCPNYMWAVRDGLSLDYVTGRPINLRAGFLTQE